MPRGPYKRGSLATRFWAKVQKASDDECWEWLACKNRGGYGRIGSGQGHGHTLGAHRISWELHYGPIPKGMSVLHSCDNTGCVNPGHLFLGTQADNVADMASKGRSADQRGEKSSRARLKWEQVNEIRRRYARGEKQTVLAKGFEVSQNAVSNIVNHKQWVKKGKNE